MNSSIKELWPIATPIVIALIAWMGWVTRCLIRMQPESLEKIEGRIEKMLEENKKDRHELRNYIQDEISDLRDLFLNTKNKGLG